MKYAPVRLPDDATDQIKALIERRYVANPSVRDHIANAVIGWLVQLPCVPVEGEPVVSVIARTLSLCYIASSGLLEDKPERYTDALRPHAEAVLAVLRGEQPHSAQSGQALPVSVDDVNDQNWVNIGAFTDPADYTKKMLRAVSDAITSAGVTARLDTAGIPFAATYIHRMESRAAAVAALRAFADLAGSTVDAHHRALLHDAASQIEAHQILRPRRAAAVRHHYTGPHPPPGDTREVDGRRQVYIGGAWFWVGDQVDSPEVTA